jgi:hypothetical protein
MDASLQNVSLTIIAMHWDLWEQLGTALCANSAVNMRSSDNTLTVTARLLRNFPLTIGPATFYLQIQAINNLPCEVLLGHPFFALTQALMIDNSNGTMELELNDPNSRMKLQVPTHEKRHLWLLDSQAGSVRQ